MIYAQYYIFNEDYVSSNIQGVCLFQEVIDIEYTSEFYFT